MKKLHSQNAGLKTTQLGLFGNPALGKYWTEHMHSGQRLFYLSPII